MSITRAISGIRLLSSGLSRMNDLGKNGQTLSVNYGPVEQSIREKLSALLEPSSIIVTNDSWQHRHHTAMREQENNNGETHFSVKIISDKFQNKTRIQRHQMVYAALAEEFSQGLHALSLETKTQAEIAAKKV